MISDHGTGGIAHTIHVAKEEDGELSDFRKFENVLDVMNLPNGTVKFFFEGDETLIQGGRIVRSSVKGLDDSFRYRCSECLVTDTDVISQCDRGDSITLTCSVCETETEHEKTAIEDI